jgi:small neutral amino acid transporter SnatA (MarC family)
LSFISFLILFLHIIITKQITLIVIISSISLYYYLCKLKTMTQNKCRNEYKRIKISLVLVYLSFIFFFLIYANNIMKIYKVSLNDARLYCYLFKFNISFITFHSPTGLFYYLCKLSPLRPEIQTKKYANASKHHYSKSI